MNRLALGMLAAGAAVWTSAPAAAQSRALQQRLEDAARVECRFTTLATGDWEQAASTADVTDAEREAVFVDINVAEGTADADTRYGASYIIVRYSSGYLHFLEMSDAGPLQITTVFAQETADGRLKAVQTRHEFSPTRLPGFTSRPEMYVGDCTVAGE